MPTVAFLGSQPLGQRCLELLDAHDDLTVSVVVTYPREYDAWWDGSVNERALDLGYDVLVHNELEWVHEIPGDYLVSVYHRDIIGVDLLDNPDELPLNLHQAELPRCRGSTVFTHSMMNARGDDHWRHGTTLHVMIPEVDAEGVIDRASADICEDDTAGSLYERVRERSVDLFESWLPRLADRTVSDHRTPRTEFDSERYFYAKDSLDSLKEITADAFADPARETELYDRLRRMFREELRQYPVEARRFAAIHETHRGRVAVREGDRRRATARFLAVSWLDPSVEHLSSFVAAGIHPHVYRIAQDRTARLAGVRS